MKAKKEFSLDLLNENCVGERWDFPRVQLLLIYFYYCSSFPKFNLEFKIRKFRNQIFHLCWLSGCAICSNVWYNEMRDWRFVPIFNFISRQSSRIILTGSLGKVDKMRQRLIFVWNPQAFLKVTEHQRNLLTTLNSWPSWVPLIWSTC